MLKDFRIFFLFKKTVLYLVVMLRYKYLRRKENFMEIISGIYIIRNLLNNKVYIGSSIGIKGRIQKHKSQLRGNYHSNRYLQNAWNKYGEDSFVFEIVEEVNGVDREDLMSKCLVREQWWLNQYKPYIKKNGYNQSRTSNGNSNAHISEETRLKLSKAHKGRKHSDEIRKRMSEGSKGRLHTEETKQKIREVNLGNKHSEETKQKMSDSHKGRIVSEDTRKKISEKNSGENHHKAKFKEEDILNIKRLIKSKQYTFQEIGDMYNVGRAYISLINTKRIWKHVELEV
jgi:group I intron endonuclease